jgi:hypothetical protein
MRKLITACALLISVAAGAQQNTDSLVQKIDSLENALNQMNQKEAAREEAEHISQVWKQKKIFNVGFMNQTLENVDTNEDMDSKSAFFLQFGRTISLHKKPIANVLKFGLDWVTDISYGSYEKIDNEDFENEYGDEYEGGYDDEFGDLLDIELGRHQLSVGIGIGPSVTYAPFANKRSGVAHLKVNTYFRLTPSYSAIILSENDETEFNNAFCLYKNWGIGLQWKAIYAGFETRWGQAKYKMTNFDEDSFGDYEDMEGMDGFGGLNSLFNSGEKIKFKTTSSRIYIGFRF